MKKMIFLLLSVVILCGCGAQDTLETVSDELVLDVFSQPREILLTLPEETLLPAMESEGRTLYLCDGYDVAVQILEGGDLNATVQQISGFDSADLTLMETAAGEYTRYEFVWTMATDLGEQVGRAMILDDGIYHYTVTATAPAEKAQEYQEMWNGMFETVTLS